MVQYRVAFHSFKRVTDSLDSFVFPYLFTCGNKFWRTRNQIDLKLHIITFIYVTKNRICRHVSLYDIFTFSYQKYGQQWFLGTIETIIGMEPVTCQDISHVTKLRAQFFQKRVK